MPNKVTVSFEKKTEGLAKSENGETPISFTGNGLAPYELFLSGYASCLHATFIGIAKKQRVSFDSATYDVTGYKREEVPTVLNKIILDVTLSGVDKTKEKKLEKALHLAEKYCSISDTIKRLELEFKLNIIYK
ncbi:MAG: OsmC family protein [Candidatus Izimaplasma sp.]|nr:OsmC family protein [Candidatus Izimaplasma bacterium]